MNLPDPTPPRAWPLAFGGSLAAHALIAAGLWLSDFDLPVFHPSRFGTAGARTAPTVRIADEDASLPPGAGPADSLVSSEDVRTALAARRQVYEQLSPAQLAQQLRRNRAALEKVPPANLEGVTTFLDGVLPAQDYSFTRQTNAAGQIEYLVKFNGSDDIPMVFTAEEWEESGLGNILEDPLLAPFLRYLGPMLDTPAAPAKTNQVTP